jgi:hypothetical protein
MPTCTTAVTGPAMALRDRSLLAPFAEDMAQRLSRLGTGPSLETLADTGALTLALGSATTAGVTITTTDPNPAAIEYASARSGMTRVTWQRADPYGLPFNDAAFGIVARHFGVVALSDRIAACKEARRVAGRVGRFTFSGPAHIRHNPVIFASG